MTKDSCALLVGEETEIVFDYPDGAECFLESSLERVAVRCLSPSLPPTPSAPTTTGNATLNTMPTKQRLRILIVVRKEESKSDAEPEYVKTANKFLEGIHRLSDARDENAALDQVIEHFEEWLEKGDWMTCNRVLAAADVNRLLPTVSLGILSMTLVEKKRMSSSRPTFYRRVWRRLAVEFGEPEAVEDLQGLE